MLTAGRMLNPLAANFVSPICLYHATFDNVPHGMEQGLHNVAPDNLIAQVRWIKRHFDIVPIDDWFASEDRRGKAAITFDDGYRSCLQQTIPRLIDEGVPSTVFLCSGTFSGDIFWRDKVRLLLNAGLIDDFLGSAGDITDVERSILALDFYRGSKDPRIDSEKIDTLIDSFFSRHELTPKLEAFRLCAENVVDLPDHPLVTYGNHTHRHYVLSSLDEARQRQQISQTEEFLKKAGVRRSRIFSVPFGGLRDFDDTTLRICQDLGFNGVLLSRQRLNWNRKEHLASSLGFGERFLVPDGSENFHKTLFRQWVLLPIARYLRLR